MFSPKESLRSNYLIKLIAAMAVLLLIFSFVLFHYIRYNLEAELHASLTKHAEYLLAKDKNLEHIVSRQKELLKKTLGIQASIVQNPRLKRSNSYFRIVHRKDGEYLLGYFPIKTQKRRYLRLEMDISQPMHMLKEVFRAIVLLNLLSMGLIIFYAYILSRMLIFPVTDFSQRLIRMNENLLETLHPEEFPIEFRPLARSINHLVTRIKNHYLYRKELFVGTAHELKTPLAVMKTRSQVALIKRKKSPKDLEKVLRENIETIDAMDALIGQILQFGRDEGAQFDAAVEEDIVSFIQKKIAELQLLAHAQNKEISIRCNPTHLTMRFQPHLVDQILRNLVQNALRYTPEGGILRIACRREGNEFLLSVEDEGPGIENDLDLFAPFRRSKDSPGAGLGLFLVRNAVDAMGGSIILRNRSDGQGAVALLRLPIQEEE
ncbi:sensor histidine kinase [Nitratifractor sp.]